MRTERGRRDQDRRAGPRAHPRSSMFGTEERSGKNHATLDCGQPRQTRSCGPINRGALHTMIGLRSTSMAHAVLVFLLLWAPRIACGDASPDPARGLYAIWSRPEISDHLDFLKGDQ